LLLKAYFSSWQLTVWGMEFILWATPLQTANAILEKNNKIQKQKPKCPGKSLMQCSY